jgi:hypothetical protein
LRHNNRTTEIHDLLIHHLLLICRPRGTPDRERIFMTGRQSPMLTLAIITERTGERLA